MSKVFLHLGAHKTATTFIQANLVANRGAFAKQGWRPVYFTRENPEVIEQIKILRKGRAIEKDAQKMIDDCFAELRNDPKNLFLSSETIIGSMNIKDTKGVIYPHRMRMLNLLRDGFRGRDITVGFSVRNLADFVESSYCFLVAMHAATYSFDQYIKNTVTENLSWIRVIESIIEVFGEENIRLWEYEDFRKDSVQSFKELARIAGLDPKGVSVPKLNPRNVSIATGAAPIQLAFNRLMKKDPSIGPNKRENLMIEMRDVLLKVRPEQREPLLSPEKREAFTAQYNKELAIIRERWGKYLIPLPRRDAKQQKEAAPAA
jgi:hypothetical protein